MHLNRVSSRPRQAQPLAELQQGDQREPPRRAGRLAALRVEVGEVAVREDGGPEPVAKDEVGIAAVALARKLLVALWRYLTAGLVPEGARLKGA